MERLRPILPFLAAAAGIATFSVMDALMKHASIATGVYSALLLRNTLGSLLMLPVWLIPGGRWPRGDVLRLHLLRSAVVAAMALLFFWGLVRIPLAEAIAISFIAPLIALYLAAVLLGEQINPRAILASAMGFIGMLVIAGARLGSGGFERDTALGIAAVLGSAVLYAWNLVLQRRQAQVADPREIAFFQNMLVTMFIAPAAPWLLVWPDTAILGNIAAGAVLAGVSLLLLSWGYARAEAQALVTIEYTGFIWASIMGWMWFGEPVTVPTLLGVVLIVAACLIAARKPTEQTAL